MTAKMMNKPMLRAYMTLVIIGSIPALIYSFGNGAGAGETAITIVAAAIGNAIFDATGRAQWEAVPGPPVYSGSTMPGGYAITPSGNST